MQVLICKAACSLWTRCCIICGSMATCGFRLHPSRTSRFTEHAAGIEMLRWRLPPCESALAAFSRNCALTLTTMFHRKDHQFTEIKMRERHGTGRSEANLSRTDPSEKGMSGTDPSQKGVSGTHPSQNGMSGTDPSQMGLSRTDPSQMGLSVTDSPQTNRCRDVP